MKQEDFDRALDSAILRDSRHEDDLHPYHPIWDGDQYIGGKPVLKPDAPMDPHPNSYPVPQAATAGSTTTR